MVHKILHLHMYKLYIFEAVLHIIIIPKQHPVCTVQETIYCIFLLIYFFLFINFMLLLLSSSSHVWLCDPIDGSPTGSPCLGFSRQEHWSGLQFPSPMHARMQSSFSCVRLCATPWTAAHQAPLSTGFSRQEYWSGLPFPSPY